jgi:hypothetical protein
METESDSAKVVNILNTDIIYLHADNIMTSHNKAAFKLPLSCANIDTPFSHDE